MSRIKLLVQIGEIIEATPGEITGFMRFVKGEENYHGLDQIISRGVNPETLYKTVTEPLVKIKQAGEHFLYLRNEAAVVLNKYGQVVTAYTEKYFKENIRQVLKSFSK